MEQYDGTHTDSVPMLEYTFRRTDITKPAPAGARRVVISRPPGAPIQIQAQE